MKLSLGRCPRGSRPSCRAQVDRALVRGHCSSRRLNRKRARATTATTATTTVTSPKKERSITVKVPLLPPHRPTVSPAPLAALTAAHRRPRPPDGPVPDGRRECNDAAQLFRPLLLLVAAHLDEDERDRGAARDEPSQRPRACEDP